MGAVGVVDDYRRALTYYEFVGSWKEIKRLWHQAVSGGVWRDLGHVKCFELSDGVTRHYWWPHTSDILICHTPPVDLMRCSRIDWMRRRPPAGVRTGFSRWSAFAAPGISQASLPELLFRAPAYFFDHWYCEFEDFNGPHLELAELLDKLTSIRIDRLVPDKKLVVHRFGVEGCYQGFELTAEFKPKPRSRGMAVVQSYLDLTTAFRGACMEGTARSLPVSSLIHVIDGNVHKAWDRERCEAFFDDNRNFFERTERFDDEDANWREIGDPI